MYITNKQLASVADNNEVTGTVNAEPNTTGSMTWTFSIAGIPMKMLSCEGVDGLFSLMVSDHAVLTVLETLKNNHEPKKEGEENANS